MQSSYLQKQKTGKKHWDDAGYEEQPEKKGKKDKKKDYSDNRKSKRGEE